MTRASMALGTAALLIGSWAVGQTAGSETPVPQPQQTQPRPAPQGKPQSPPDAAGKFPYPGETEPAPDPSAEPSHTPQAGAPSADGAGKNFPYPGDPEAAGSSSSSSSSSSAPPAGDSADTPVEAQPPGRRRLPREFHPQSPEDRVTEDLQVARFYRDKGDFHAAYLRAQDAVKTLPADPEGHFVLAQLAQQMKRREEAIAEFQNYVRLEPDGDHVKEARRRLAEMR